MIFRYRVRVMYMFLLLILYEISYSCFNIKLGIKGNALFLGLIFLYYLFDILNFKDRKFEAKDIIYSVLINCFIFGMNFLLRLNYKILFSLVLFSIFQLLFKRLLIKNRINVVKVLIIDDGRHLDRLIGVLKGDIKYVYIGYVSDEKFKEDNYLGKVSDIGKIVKRKRINEVVFTNKKQIKNHSDLIVKVKLDGIKVIDYINFLEYVEGKVDVDEINSMWVLFTSGFETFSNAFQKRMKRMFDLVVSSILLILAFPFMFITFFLVKLDGGPAFFKQKRIGHLGKDFEIIKFRSMKVHDPKKFSKYASENDDRIGKIGGFIRKTRLDELPQLINVFKGEMSFVGPRPEWNELGRNYEEKIKNYKLRYTVRPGITGWAQTMYFYSSNLEEVKNKLEYDLFYVKNHDLILDIVILFKTVKIVLFGKGM